jgi:hypothetical protein
MPHRSHPATALLLVLGVAALTLGAAAIASAAGEQDPVLGRCGAYNGNNSVRGVYEIPHADRIWDLLPAMKQAPELLTEAGPATVVVFDGAYQADWTAADGTPAVVYNVVCVLTTSGARNIYYDVSLDGFTGLSPAPDGPAAELLGE